MADKPPYVYQPYPKCLYHATEEMRVVRNEAEHKALGPDWYESPDEAKEAAAAAAAAEAEPAGVPEPAADVPEPANPLGKCPCGSGRRYYLCHGAKK